MPDDSLRVSSTPNFGSDLWTLSRTLCPVQLMKPSEMAYIAAHLNAEIILVVTSVAVRYKLPLSPLSPPTIGTTCVKPTLKLD